MPTKEELMRQFSLAEEKEKKPPEAEQQQADSTQAEQPSEQQPLVPNSHEHGKKRKKRKKKFGKVLFGILQDKTLNKMLNVFLICLIVHHTSQSYDGKECPEDTTMEQAGHCYKRENSIKIVECHD